MKNTYYHHTKVIKTEVHIQFSGSTLSESCLKALNLCSINSSTFSKALIHQA